MFWKLWGEIKNIYQYKSVYYCKNQWIQWTALKREAKPYFKEQITWIWDTETLHLEAVKKKRSSLGSASVCRQWFISIYKNQRARYKSTCRVIYIYIHIKTQPFKHLQNISDQNIAVYHISLHTVYIYLSLETIVFVRTVVCECMCIPGEMTC